MFPARTIRRYAPLVLLSAAAVLAWRAGDLADVDDERIDPVLYDHELATPLLSARRVPRSLQAPIADDALQPGINTVLTGSTPDTCLIVTADGRVVGTANPLTALVPASNMKLPTTYAALATFGPDHRFTTRVAGTAPIIDGVVEGDLFLIGGGDPFLATDNWWAQYDTMDARAHTRLEDLADRIAERGIIAINGAIVGDESLFDTERIGPWAQRLIDTRQSGPLSALAVNEGFTSWPAVFEGTFRPRVPSSDPAAHAASVLAELLRQRNITVEGSTAGPAPQEAVVLAEIESPPLSELITHVNTYSHNFGAEVLLKHLGLVGRGEGSTAAGAAVVTELLAERRFAMTGVTITDGSGLGEDSTLTCQLITDILLDTGPHSRFAESLSIGGVSGSIAQRHQNSPATGHVFAKTGTLINVTALSGFVYSPVEPGSTVTFAYIVNGELAGQDESIRGLQEPFVEALATFPAGPPVASLIPLAPVAVTPAAPNPDATGTPD